MFQNIFKSSECLPSVDLDAFMLNSMVTYQGLPKQFPLAHRVHPVAVEANMILQAEQIFPPLEVFSTLNIGPESHTLLSFHNIGSIEVIHLYNSLHSSSSSFALFCLVALVGRPLLSSITSLPESTVFINVSILSLLSIPRLNERGFRG